MKKKKKKREKEWKREGSKALMWKDKLEWLQIWGSLWKFFIFLNQDLLPVLRIIRLVVRYFLFSFFLQEIIRKTFLLLSCYLCGHFWCQIMEEKNDSCKQKTIEGASVSDRSEQVGKQKWIQHHYTLEKYQIFVEDRKRRRASFK